MLQNGKRRWTTPQLIVLVRGKPEEKALVACKVGDIEYSGSVSGPSVAYVNCESTEICERCSGIAGS